jgi:S-formylglutathione hydrolase
MLQVSASLCFGGQQLRYRHQSSSLNCDMHFSIFLPPGASENSPVPVIYWLSGLTCTDENFVHKAGAQRYAVEQGVALVVPDTSPRGHGVPGDANDAWDFGLGAGFYVDAEQSPWREHYNMYSYVTGELPALIENAFPVSGRKSIMGHSMGGHGALVIALKNAQQYHSVSAFAPICAPSECPWGQKAFSAYLGDERSVWVNYDTCALIASMNLGNLGIPLLIDQGRDDPFLVEQLLPQRLLQVCAEHAHPLEFRWRDGYDHGYFFVASFIGEHIAYHARHLVSA